MLPRNHPDHIQVSFDDHRLVDNAGLILPATLAQLDRVKLTVNIGLGIRKEAIASPTIGILRVNEQHDSQGSGHEEAPRETKNRPCSSTWTKPSRLQGRLHIWYANRSELSSEFGCN